MSDYYVLTIDRTFFLSGSKIYSSEGTGSSVDKSNGIEFTKDWIRESQSNYQDWNINEIFYIGQNVSGSNMYFFDNFYSGSVKYSLGD